MSGARFPRRFRDADRQKAYEQARRSGADASSTYYHQGKPHRGAGHRCAYWDAREGKPSTYSDPSIAAYPYWRAGADDRTEIDGLPKPITWKEWQAENIAKRNGRVLECFA